MSDASQAWLDDPHLTGLRHEVFRLIGKSIYLYQEIEKRIKILNIAIRLKMSVNDDPSGWQKQIEQQQSWVNKQSMGTLMAQLMEDLYVAPEPVRDKQLQPSKDKSDEQHITVKIQLQIETTAAFIQQKKDMVNAFVRDRNHLVHHYFERVNFADAQMLKQMSADLVKGHSQIDTEMQWLNELIQLSKELSATQTRWLNSAEGHREFERMRLQNAWPICFLELYANTDTRTDGWTIFDAATTRLKKEYPTEVAQFFEKFEYKNLDVAARAAGLYAFKYEETSRGRRLLYKNHPSGYQQSYHLESPENKTGLTD